MGSVIFVTGFKGGVGKTTVTAALASCLAALGQHVLVVDGDFGMRCMDLVLGTESRVVFDCNDLLYGRCTDDDAIVSCRGRMDFLPAPMNYDGVSPPADAYRTLFGRLKKRYDFVLIDSGADLTDHYKYFASVADDAIVVSMHQSTSVRAAERTAQMLAGYNLRSMRIIINGFRKKSACEGRLPDVLDIIRASSLQLLGIIPYDDRIPTDQEQGTLAFGGSAGRKAKTYEIAFMNTAKRIMGQKVPLFAGQAVPAKIKSYL